MRAENKPVFNEKRIELYKFLPLTTPFAFGFGVSQLCNIKCKYCFQSSSKEELTRSGFISKNMEWDVFLKTLNELKKFPEKIKSISMAGQGEPLCNPLFPQMIEAVKKSNVTDDISVITNGLLLTKKLGRDIIDAGLDRIFISLQGLNATKYEEICGRKIDFNKFLERLAYFYEYSRGKCKVNIKIADIALNDDEKGLFFELFGDICDRIHIETIKPLYGNVDYTNILKEDKTQVTTTRFGRLHRRQSACYLSFFMMCVDPEGKIKPCGTVWNPCPEFGNVFENELINVWNGMIRKKFLLGMLKGQRFENHVCKDCDFPNDVPTKADEIDPYVEFLLNKFQE